MHELVLKERSVPNLVADDLPETASFEIIRSTTRHTALTPAPAPVYECDPVFVDSSWHGRHGISRFSAEALRRLRIPRRFVGSGAQPATPGDLVASWRRGLTRDDVVYSPGFNAGLTRARQVLTLHDLIHLSDREEGSLAKRTYYEGVVRPAVRKAGAVLTVSEVSRHVIQEWLRDDDVEVINVGNGCSELFFQPTQILRDPSQLLYVGNLKPHKNPAPVFAALAGLPDLRLTVVASDVAEARLLAATHGVTDRVEVIASCTDRELKALYASSGALVIPSFREGFGLPAVEALAVGTPVVYWQGCASVAEVVGPHGVAVASSSDPDAWIQAISATANGARPFARPEGWQGRWGWDAVAARIDAAVYGVVTR